MPVAIRACRYQMQPNWLPWPVEEAQTASGDDHTKPLADVLPAEPQNQIVVRARRWLIFVGTPCS